MTDDVKPPQVDPAVPASAVPLPTVPDATAVVVPPAADAVFADPIPGAEPIPGATTGSVDTSVIQTVAQTVIPVVIEPVTEVIEPIATILPEVVVPAATTVDTTVPVVAAAPVVVAPVTPVVVAVAPYIPPVATDLSATAPTVTAVDPLTPKPSDDVLNPSTVTPQTDAPSFELGLDVIGATKMTNAKGTAATAIIVERINRHMNFLIGKSAFATPAARELEQTTFIETIGNTLRLPYDQYALVTNQLLTAIKNNLDVFEKGLAYRFMAGLDKKIPKQILDIYRSYIRFLTVVASNWVGRSRLDKKIDIASVTATFPAKVMKENATRYYREIMAQ